MVGNAAKLAYTSGHSAEERERLILEHLPQVKWIALRIHDSLQGSVMLDDLISTGIIGLIHAVDNFDASFNTKLKTYAEYKIRGAILDSIRGQDGIPEHRRKHLKQISAAIQSLQASLMRMPEEEEIAALLGISLSEYREWLLSVQGVSLSSLDVVAEQGEGSQLHSLIADRNADSPSEQMERSELERLVTQAIDRMPKVERTILSLYYEQELSLREIAQVMGIHHTRVSQLKTQAILRLRTNLDRRWPAGRGRRLAESGS